MQENEKKSVRRELYKRKTEVMRETIEQNENEEAMVKDVEDK
jgi:hypothetical protein